jgi:transketolase C-terminal domain/subunit
MPTIIRSLMAFILFLGLASSQTMSAEDDIDPRAARRPMVATIIKYPPSVREGQTFAIEVKVVDARTKKPVEGALVENIVSGYSIIVRQGRTGSNGIGSATAKFTSGHGHNRKVFATVTKNGYSRDKSNEVQIAVR